MFVPPNRNNSNKDEKPDGKNNRPKRASVPDSPLVVVGLPGDFLALVAAPAARYDEQCLAHPADYCSLLRVL